VLPNFVDFVESVTDRRDRQKTVNDMSQKLNEATVIHDAVTIHRLNTADHMN